MNGDVSDARLRRVRVAVAVLCGVAVACLLLWYYCTTDYLPACAAHPARLPVVLLVTGAGCFGLVLCCPALAVTRPRTVYEAAPWFERAVRRQQSRMTTAVAVRASKSVDDALL